MRKYDLHIFTFNEIKKGNKLKKEIIDVNFYESISFKLAKYLATKEEKTPA